MVSDQLSEKNTHGQVAAAREDQLSRTDMKVFRFLIFKTKCFKSISSLKRCCEQFTMFSRW